MKIGWGTKIAILYIGFVMLVMAMVIISMNQKVELVSEDHYQQELVFQNQINSTDNANALPEKISHSFSSSGIELQFPSVFKGEAVSGKINFFLPSDASRDLSLAIKLDDNGCQAISYGGLINGMYRMQISWKVRNKNYYSEDIVHISR